MVLSLVISIGTLLYTLIDTFMNDENIPNKLGIIVSCISLITLLISLGSLMYITKKFIAMPFSDLKLDSTEYICALKDDSQVEGEIRGNRYSIRGYIDEKLYYSYLVKLSDGSKIVNKIPADKTKIYEVSDNFRVEWYKQTKSFFDLSEEIYTWKLYIPKGSITDDYLIDLE